MRRFKLVSFEHLVRGPVAVAAAAAARQEAGAASVQGRNHGELLTHLVSGPVAAAAAAAARQKAGAAARPAAYSCSRY